jgi:type IV secretory pathway VirB9-like protein
MYADNLGSIPPNTALMVVTVAGKRYEVNITSTEQTSGTVRFRLKEE